MKRRTMAAGLAAAMVAPVIWAQAPQWPTRAVRLIVPYPAGGGVDVLARALSQKLQERWGQTVTVDNRPGANTLIGTEVAVNSNDGHTLLAASGHRDPRGADVAVNSNDGHTLLVTTDATFTINPHLYSKLPYDIHRDFTPLTRMVSFSQLLVASTALPVNTLPELVALARSKPGQLSYASYGPGSQPQLATEILKQKARIFILHIPYRGIPQAVTAVVSGEVPLTWAGIPSARPHIQSGRIKALAYGGKQRTPVFPDVPTVGESGYPEIDANVWVGLFAPAGMNPGLAERIQRDVTAILTEPAFKAREIDAKGYDLVASTAQELSRHIRDELASRAGPIRYSGAKVD